MGFLARLGLIRQTPEDFKLTALPSRYPPDDAGIPGVEPALLVEAHGARIGAITAAVAHFFPQHPELKPSLEKLFLNLASWMQQVPASRNHHHSEIGGLFAHTLDVILIGLQERTDVHSKHGLFGHDAKIADLAWPVSIIVGGALHDIAKPAMSMTITSRLRNDPFDAPPVWDPYRFSLYDFLKSQRSDRAYLQWRPDNSVAHHEAYAIAWFFPVVPSYIRSLLFNSPERYLSQLFDFLRASPDVTATGNQLAFVVRKADEHSTASDIYERNIADKWGLKGSIARVFQSWAATQTWNSDGGWFFLGSFPQVPERLLPLFVLNERSIAAFEDYAKKFIPPQILPPKSFTPQRIARYLLAAKYAYNCSRIDDDDDKGTPAIPAQIRMGALPTAISRALFLKPQHFSNLGLHTDGPIPSYSLDPELASIIDHPLKLAGFVRAPGGRTDGAPTKAAAPAPSADIVPLSTAAPTQMPAGPVSAPERPAQAAPEKPRPVQAPAAPAAPAPSQPATVAGVLGIPPVTSPAKTESPAPDLTQPAPVASTSSLSSAAPSGSVADDADDAEWDIDDDTPDLISALEDIPDEPTNDPDLQDAFDIGDPSDDDPFGLMAPSGVETDAPHDDEPDPLSLDGETQSEPEEPAPAVEGGDPVVPDAAEIDDFELFSNRPKPARGDAGPPPDFAFLSLWSDRHEASELTILFVAYLFEREYAKFGGVPKTLWGVRWGSSTNAFPDKLGVPYETILQAKPDFLDIVSKVDPRYWMFAKGAWPDTDPVTLVMLSGPHGAFDSSGGAFQTLSDGAKVARLSGRFLANLKKSFLNELALHYSNGDAA